MDIYPPKKMEIFGDSPPGIMSDLSFSVNPIGWGGPARQVRGYKPLGWATKYDVFSLHHMATC